MSTGKKTDKGGQTALSNWQLARRLLGLAWEFRWGCVRIVLLQLFLLAFGMYGLGLMGVGVDYIRYRIAGPAVAGVVIRPPSWPFGLRPPDAWPPMAVVGAIAGAILALAVVRGAVNLLYVVWLNKLVQARIVVQLRARVYAKMQRLSFRFFDDNASGSIINRVTGDVQAVRSFVDGVVMHSVILVLSLCVYLAYMSSIHVGLTLACLASSPLLWHLTARFSDKVRPAYEKNRDLFDKQVLVISENIQGMHVVKGFAREAEQAQKFRKATEAVRDQQNWIFDMVSLFQPIIGSVTQLNIVVLLAYGGYLVVCRERAPGQDEAVSIGISVGQLLVFAGLLQQFSGQVAQAANIANTMQQSLTAARRVFEVLDSPLEIASRPGAVKLPSPRGEIRFENATFGYEPGAPVLEDVSFTVEPGQVVAILGATGTGKSSLLGLVPRFHDVRGGRVLVDGCDVRDLDIDDLRRAIGMVFQESFLFSNTVAANIAFGAPGATREAIERAARTAAAHEFIASLPDGYDTVLREGGVSLSGGQRQRIALARAILLEPRILLLDDPTASVDPETEDEIMGAMEGAMVDRTTLIVAHRLSTLRRADLVLVLDRGRIVQRGTHDELIGVKGHYRRAADMQIPDQESLRILGEEQGDFT